MRKKLTFLFLVAIAFCAQHTFAQTFTAKAGFNLSDIKEKGGGVFTPDYDMKPGFHAGIAAEFPINSWASIEPAVLYNNRGAKLETNVFGTDVSAKLNLHYIDVPVNFKVAKSMDNDMRVYATAGPYVAVGIAGKVKGEVVSPNGTESADQDIEWGNSDDDTFKRVEMGATFGAGVEVKMMQFGISYDLGLSNNATGDQSDYTSKNRVLKFSVGYRFGRK